MDDDETMEHPRSRVGEAEHGIKSAAGNIRQMAETLDVVWMDPEAITEAITTLVDARARVRERQLAMA
jgi:hypothetical protein